MCFNKLGNLKRNDPDAYKRLVQKIEARNIQKQDIKPANNNCGGNHPSQYIIIGDTRDAPQLPLNSW
jgi:hypothetical protein